jgi:hypothetical protein
MRNPKTPARLFAASLPVAVAAGLLVNAFAARAQDKAPVTYPCRGFDEPMQRSPQQISRGRVLPLRGKLVLPGGGFCDRKTVQAPPALTLTYRPEGKPEVDKTSGMEVRDYGKGNSFVWDDEAHWKFDLGTGNLPDDGEYVARMVSGDEKEYHVNPPCEIVFKLHGGGPDSKEK